MREFFASTTIQASPETVWRALSDIERWPTWTPTVTQARVFNGALPDRGERVLLRQPKLRDAVWTVTRWDPQRRFTWQSKHPGVVVEGDHILAATPQGVEVHLRLTFRGWLSALVLRFIGDRSRSYLETEAASLKSFCEGRQ